MKGYSLGIYTYDRAGNRTSKDSATYTINTVNEVTALSDGTSFTYDSNSNRTQKTKGTDTFVSTLFFVGYFNYIHSCAFNGVLPC